jgi:hypothetical protein
VREELSVLIDHPWPRSRGRTIALEYLREAVRHSDRQVTLEGETISREPRSWIDTQRGAGPGYRFVAGFERSDDGTSVIELWTAGVRVETLSGNGRAFRAAIEFDAPRRDLSRLKIVRDETVEQALAAVEQVRGVALRELEAADAKWTNETRPVAWPPERVDRVLERPVRTSTRAPRDEAHRPLRVLALVLSGIGSDAVSASWILGLILVGMGVFAGLTTSDQSYGVIAWMLAVGFVSMVPRIVVAVWAVRARDHGTRTHAKILAVEQRQNERCRLLWSFEDDTGEQRTGHSVERSWEQAKLWERGEIITIYYDRKRPNHSVCEADVGPRKR